MNKKLLIFGIILFATIAFILLNFGGEKSDTDLSRLEKEQRWDKIKKADKSIQISPEWETPVNLGSPVNTIGWEDSVSISPNGNTITFTYFRIDPIALLFGGGKKRVDGPMRPGWPQEEPYNSHGADIYIAQKVNGIWQEPQNIGMPVNLPGTADGNQWLSSDGKRIYFNSDGGSRNSGIYYSERETANSPWKTSQYLNKNINSGYNDGNLYLSSDEKFLYFESGRPGGYGKNDFYVSEKIDGEWQEPKNLGPKINTEDEETQPFISTDGKILLFSRNEKIYRSIKQDDGFWGEPEVIVSGNVGEPTLTDFGDLYFLHVYKTNDNEFDADIMMAKKKR